MAVRRAIIEELGERTLEAIKRVYASVGTLSIRMLKRRLADMGILLSEWKLRTAIRLMAAANMIIRERKIRIVDAEPDLKSKILLEVYSRGGADIRGIVNSMSKRIGINPCEVKKALAKLLSEGKVVAEAPEGLIGLWVKLIEEDHCDEATVDPEDYPGLIQLAEQLPSFFERSGDKIIVKNIMDAKVFLYPVD